MILVARRMLLFLYGTWGGVGGYFFEAADTLNVRIMKTSISRLSGLLFSGCSLAFFLLVVVYRYYFDPVSGTWEEHMAQLTKDWEIIAFIWGCELVAVVLIAWSALNLAKCNRFWNLVAIGHLLMSVEYVLMLGGYPAVQSEEMYHLINRLAVVVFAAANLLWIIGMAGLYAYEEGWIKYIGTGIAVVAGALFTFVFSSGVTMEGVVLAGPLALVVYLLNFVYGIRVFTNPHHRRR